MKFEDIQDIQPVGAREDILDLWVWAKSNPDREIPALDEERWTTWRQEMEELQPRAAEVWAHIADAMPSSLEVLSGAAFPSWFGEDWVEVISYMPWSSELESSIGKAEEWFGVNRPEVPAQTD